MNPSFLLDIDKQIAQLEKQLSALYSKRVSALEAEIQRSKSRSEALGGAPEAPVAKAPASPAVKRNARLSRKQTAKAKGSEQPAPAAEESKPAPETAKIEASAQSADPAVVSAPKKKAAAKAKQPKKRTRTPTAVVEKRILDVLKGAGLFGISQIEISKQTGLGYQTVVKKLKELKGIEKKGSGKEGRFLLKA